jgi:hypothetical protein
MLINVIMHLGADIIHIPELEINFRALKIFIYRVLFFFLMNQGIQIRNYGRN